MRNRPANMVIEFHKHKPPETLIDAMARVMPSPSRPQARRIYQAIIEEIDKAWDEITDDDDPDFPTVFVHPSSNTEPQDPKDSNRIRYGDPNHSNDI